MQTRELAVIMLVAGVSGAPAVAQSVAGGYECDGVHPCCPEGCPGANPSEFCPPDPLGGVGSDLQVGNVTDFCGWGSNGAADPIAAFTTGNRNCNIGSKVLRWTLALNAEGMYRLTQNAAARDYRFEQVGMRWLKPGYSALTGAIGCYGETCCQTGVPPYFGIGCSDVYSATYNSSPTYRRGGTNPVTGAGAGTGGSCPPGDSAICKRLQVRHSDLDDPPSVARYFVEQQWITPDEQDEAAARNNNATYREVTVQTSSGSCCTGPCSYRLTGTAGQSAMPGDPAIRAWKRADPLVVETDVQVPGDGLFILAAKAHFVGDGWRYEYALHNLNSDRGAGSFAIPLGGAAVRPGSEGFHDVDYHSGDSVCGENWRTDLNPTPGFVRWDVPAATCTPPGGYAPIQNALWWGTLYNFRFKANQPPAQAHASIGLFKEPAAYPSPLGPVTIGPSRDAGRCNRYLPVDVAGLTNTAIRVELVSVDGFSSFNGEYRWLGPPATYSDGGLNFVAAPLQCCPYYANWSSHGIVFAYGAEVVPNSTYRLESIGSGWPECNGASYVDMGHLATAKWGDVTEAYAHVNGLGQPDQADVDAVVAKFTAQPGSIMKVKAQLQPNVPNPAASISALDIASAVDAEAGLAYPYPGPTFCPQACTQPTVWCSSGPGGGEEQQ